MMVVCLAAIEIPLILFEKGPRSLDGKRRCFSSRAFSKTFRPKSISLLTKPYLRDLHRKNFLLLAERFLYQPLPGHGRFLEEVLLEDA